MSAVAEARKLRAQDLAAQDAERDCSAATLDAIDAIKKLPQLFEADVLCLLHALQVRIERHNMHLEHWQTACAEISGVQSLLDEIMTENRADAEAERGLAERWGGF
jgi:hypothetical protein